MRVLVQRSKESKVTIDGKINGKIDKGYVLLVGFTQGDDENIIDKTISNIKEVIARGAYTIGISNEEINFLNNNIIIPKKEKIK